MYIGCARIIFIFLIFSSSVYAQESSRNTPDSMMYVSGAKGNSVNFAIMKNSGNFSSLILDNLSIDHEVFGKHKFPVYFRKPSADELMMYIISNGLADIDNIELAPPALKRAYLAQPRAQLKYPELFENKTDSKSNLAGEAEKKNAIAEFLIEYWQFVISVILAIGLSSLVFELTRRWLATRHVSLIFVGLPASGKSALRIRLHNPDATESEIERLDASAGVTSVKPKPIYSGPKIFHTTLFDIAGSESNKLMDQINQADTTYRRRLIIVFVLSATPGLTKGSVDEKFVYQQLGAIQFAAPALLKARSVIRPNAVAIFISKADIFYRNNFGSSEKSEHLELFSEHRNIISAAAQESGVKVFEFVGSAKKGWEIDRFLSSLTDAAEENR